VHKRVILLGGSFNPAHAGHVHISMEAMQALAADEVWWLLSPHNPLKERDDLADYDVRYAHAQRVVEGLPIHVSSFEQDNNLRYSIDTITALKKRYETVEFIWLIGSDNLLNFHHWREWKVMAGLVPIAVYDRAPYVEKAMQSEAAQYLASYQKSVSEALEKPLSTPCFIPLALKMHPESATQLRKKLGKKAFLAHNGS